MKINDLSSWPMARYPNILRAEASLSPKSILCMKEHSYTPFYSVMQRVENYGLTEED